MKSTSSEREDALSVGERLKHYRLQAGMSREELGLEANTSGTLIWQIEAGKRKTGPTLEMLKRLADALGVQPSDLMLSLRKERA